MSEIDRGYISLVPEGSPHQVTGDRVIILPGITLEILTTRRIELDAWFLRGLNDPFWRLYVPTEGEAFIRVENDPDSEIRLVPNQAYLIPPHTTLCSENAAKFSKWYVHFTLGPSGDRAIPGIYKIDLTDNMLSTLETLKKSKDAPFPWLSAALVAEGLQQMPVEIWTERQLDPRVERAMDFMHANVIRKLTAEDVARAAGMSVRNLNHLFNQQVQMSPMRVLLDFRLDKACRMLRHGDDSIEKIAEDCGFPNRYYFSRMLKQQRGATPAAYRKSTM